MTLRYGADCITSESGAAIAGRRVTFACDRPRRRVRNPAGRLMRRLTLDPNGTTYPKPDSGCLHVRDTQVEAKGLEPSNLLTASQALYQLSYAPGTSRYVTSPAFPTPWVRLFQGTLDRRPRFPAVGGTVIATDRGREAPSVVPVVRRIQGWRGPMTSRKSS